MKPHNCTLSRHHELTVKSRQPLTTTSRHHPHYHHHHYQQQQPSSVHENGGNINTSNQKKTTSLHVPTSYAHDPSSNDLHMVHPSGYKGKGHVTDATSRMLQTHFELGKMPSEKLKTGKHLICNSNSCSTSFIKEFPITPSNYYTTTSYQSLNQRSSSRPVSASSSIRRRASFNNSDHVYALLHEESKTTTRTSSCSTNTSPPTPSSSSNGPLSPASSKRMIEKYQQEERIRKNMIQKEEKLQQKFLTKQSSFSLVKKEMDQLNQSLRDRPHSPTPQPPGLIKQKIDQREFSNTRYAKQPLWKSRDREFTTFKIK